MVPLDPPVKETSRGWEPPPAQKYVDEALGKAAAVRRRQQPQSRMNLRDTLMQNALSEDSRAAADVTAFIYINGTSIIFRKKSPALVLDYMAILTVTCSGPQTINSPRWPSSVSARRGRVSCEGWSGCYSMTCRTSCVTVLTDFGWMGETRDNSYTQTSLARDLLSRLIASPMSSF